MPCLLLTDRRRYNGYDLLATQDGVDVNELLDDQSIMSPQMTDGSRQEESSRRCRCKKHCKYCDIIICVLVLFVMSAVSLSLGWYSWFGLETQPVIDKSIDAFSIPNHEAYKRYGALQMAESQTRHRLKRDTSHNDDLNKMTMHNEDESRKKRSINKRCALRVQTVPRWKMHLVYLAKGSDRNMFTKERLELVHKVEKQIMNHPQYGQFCFKDLHMAIIDPAIKENKGCAPLNSLMTYFFPTQDSNGQIHYDGLGSHIDDVDSALKFAMNHDEFYYFVDEKINRTYPKSRLIRTEVLFGFPLPDYECGESHEQKEKFKNFEITYIDILSKASNDKVQVLYGGNELFDYEIDSTFWGDITMAAYSLGSIFIIMFILTSFSPWLTVCGIWSILLSFPVAFFFYRVVFKINALGILNGAAAFVIIGIGVDDVFVFINIYHQSNHRSELTSRIFYTLRTAGVATFFTSFTTAAAFAANIASSIPAVYEFGLFMSLIVCSCWITVFIVMPPTLYLWQRLFSRCELRCYRGCKGKTTDCESDGSTSTHSSSISASGSIDVPMLQIDDDPTATFNTETGNDEPMIVLDPVFETPQHTPNTSTMPGFNIGKYILKFLSNYIAPVITHIKGKWIIIGVHLCILMTSIGLLSQLQPASHPPQLFHPDTNLQQLLDLKANFSILDNLRCDRCSGLYMGKYCQLVTVGDVLVFIGTVSNSRECSGLYMVRTVSNSRGCSGLYMSRYPSSKPKVSQPKHNALLPPIFNHATLPQKPQTLPQTTTLSTTEENTAVPHTTASPTTEPTTTLKTTTQKVTLHHEMRHHPTPRPVYPNRPKWKPAERDTAKPVKEGFNACKNNSCNNVKDRPRIQSGTTVYVVFGIKELMLPKVRTGHVINEDKGTVMYNDELPEAFSMNNLQSDKTKKILSDLCTICHRIAQNHHLVQNGSAQCIPAQVPYQMQRFIDMIPECRNLPQSLESYHHQHLDHALGGLNVNRTLKWIAFAFESTTSKGDSYFKAYQKYLEWDRFIEKIKTDILDADSPLRDIYQTSEFWKKVMIEIVAVYSAIYGLVLSLVICIIAVAIFTGHVVLLSIVAFTIIAMICCVVGIFYMAGWEMGAIEAISLSILVGSSVDYCVHLVEGYIIAGKTVLMEGRKNKELRKERTIYALRHIGVAIISSAITTIIAAIPLTQTVIQPFSKFGDILLINTSISILFTITLCAPLLSTFAPARYKASLKAMLKAFIGTCISICVIVIIIYIISKTAFPVPGPNGNPIFP
ncbi:hypothetical protein LOTGIDRAFT_153557 [Lottia gigantea]|uniref:SSD domain-containing protein n=1 Tax=Lottia gigantea TaxID=225164 RepID=V3ZIL1_LOTGI|nr:hypothetical protein LOTGIDRAFT_153557 [Lottia gigantea]ESO91123.1 hypothetical protein LOTGIDRAFT_153557 [Lottia gigantea]